MLSVYSKTDCGKLYFLENNPIHLDFPFYLQELYSLLILKNLSVSLIISLLLFLICAFYLCSFIGLVKDLSILLLLLFTKRKHFDLLVSTISLFSNSELLLLNLLFPSFCFLLLCCSFKILKMGAQFIFLFLMCLLLQVFKAVDFL